MELQPLCLWVKFAPAAVVFCNVKTGNPKGLIDKNEPDKVSYALAQMDLEYVVLTSVDRDDLEDEGAGHFAETVRLIKERDPKLLVEVLTPDFKGKRELVKKIVDAKPDVFAHNLETVESLTPKVRDPRAGYQQSLDVLKMVKEFDPSRYTKSSLMLGLGESDEEVFKCMKDLRDVGCDVLTFGQYLQPARRHLKVEEFVSPEKFNWWAEEAKKTWLLVRSQWSIGTKLVPGWGNFL